MRLAHCGRVLVRAGAFRRVAEIAAGVLRLLEWHLPRIALAESASASFVSRYAASAMGKVTSSMTGGCVSHEGSLRRRPRFVCKEVRRSTALMAARSRAWLFSAAQNGGRYLRPHRPQGPRHSMSSDCRGRSR